MELAAQPICLPICMNEYFFRGRFVLYLQTGNVNRSAEFSPSFLWKFTEFRAETPPMPLEFQTALPPHVFGIPVQETPPSPSEFQEAAHGMVWIFSGITQWKI